MAHLSPSIAGDGATARVRLTRSRAAGPALLAAACFVALFVPWARSGGATRSGYGFVRGLEAAGMVHGPWAHLLGVAVLVVPVLAGLSGAAAVLSFTRSSVVFCALAGLVSLAFSTWAFLKFGSHVPPGPWAGAVLGTGAVATAVRYARQRSASHAR